VHNVFVAAERDLDGPDDRSRWHKPSEGFYTHLGQAAQDAWNTRDPEKVALAYTENSKWRNRDEFFEGREAIKAFLRRKCARELDYRLEKNLWYFTGNRIAVRF
jgi:nuclear transport factor 2 (NTF2) superfamily protein